MADLTPIIETLEHRWMRAWVNRDAKTLKALTTKDFLLLMGAKPPTILDRPSLLEAAVERWDCQSYRFGDILVRREGKLGMFSASVELKARMDGRDWSGTYWLTDVWRRGRVRRGWKLAHRIFSRRDEAPEVAKAIKSLQLWK
ncbi:MAG TPA: nuclear transport factor 2 family protein [Sphingomicrobium sp.]|jgi:ketosteroid isomerase-like protein